MALARADVAAAAGAAVALLISAALHCLGILQPLDELHLLLVRAHRLCLVLFRGRTYLEPPLSARLGT